jgi:hypothetical protein
LTASVGVAVLPGMAAGKTSIIEAIRARFKVVARKNLIIDFSFGRRAKSTCLELASSGPAAFLRPASNTVFTRQQGLRKSGGEVRSGDRRDVYSPQNNEEV